MEQQRSNAPAAPGGYERDGQDPAALQQQYMQQQYRRYPASAPEAASWQTTGYGNRPAELPVGTAQLLSAGLFGMIVAGTGTMGANLHKVRQGDMSLGEALSESLAHGAAAGVATAAATAAASSLTRGGLLGLGVTLATATGVSYLINKPK